MAEDRTPRRVGPAEPDDDSIPAPARRRDRHHEDRERNELLSEGRRRIEDEHDDRNTRRPGRLV